MHPSKSLVIPSVSMPEAHEQEHPLFVNCWPTATPDSKNVLFVLHGLGEHGGRYEHLAAAENLGTSCSRVYAIDQRGHGRSGGLRGYAPTLKVMVEDLKKVVREIEGQERGKRLFFYGHSFGGLVGLNYLLSEKKVPFTAAVISAPLLGIALKVPAVKKFVGEVVGKLLPKLQLTNEINPGFLSHDPAVVEAYVRDRLVHGKITPKLYFEMLAAMDFVGASRGPLACPTLFLVPGQDQVVDTNKTLAFYRGLKDEAKELREYPHFYHEPHNEVEKEKVFADVRAWISKWSADGADKRGTA